MAWVKLDDRFWSNRKVRKAGNSIGVYVLTLAWSADELTDGRIPCDELDFICTGIDDPKHHAERLADPSVALFVRDGDDYVIPDYLEFNESADTIRARREKDRQRKAKGGRAASPRTPDGIQTDSGRNPDGLPMESGSPDPTRPDPTKREAPQAAPAPSKRKRGTRISTDWQPSANVSEAMLRQYPNVNPDYELAKFVDYWLAKSGKDATKNDWDACWRNWVRRAAGDSPQSTSTPQRPSGGDVGLAPFVPPVFEGHDVPSRDEAKIDLEELNEKLPEHLRNRITRRGKPQDIKDNA